jgi:carbon-monoxide dehydrogenase small subunit
MVLAIQTNGSKITTVEGLSKDGKLSPLQEAFWECHALQCGYCTPGMLMSSYFLLLRNPNPTDEEVRRALEGNICMCTGYLNIIKAVKAAAAKISKTTAPEIQR